MCKDTGEEEFNYNDTDCIGQPSIPLELKVLTCLRILASGVKFQEAIEMNGFQSYSSANKFFKDFCRLFRSHYEKEFIKPLEGDDLIRCLTEYARMGLPGCVGSMDATFVAWEKTNKNLRNVCDGDKGVGLLYNTVVTHFKKVVAVEGSYYSTINDKISVKYSDYVNALEMQQIYKDVSYKISDT